MTETAIYACTISNEMTTLLTGKMSAAYSLSTLLMFNMLRSHMHLHDITNVLLSFFQNKLQHKMLNLVIIQKRDRVFFVS